MEKKKLAGKSQTTIQAICFIWMRKLAGLLGGPSAVVSKFGSTNDSPAPVIHLADAAALPRAWHPTNFPNSHILPSVLPSQMPIRGQFGNGVVDQMHSDPGNTRNMPHVTLPQISSIHPGLVPLNMRRPLQPSMVHPNLLMAQAARPNLLLPSSSPFPSKTMVPHLNYGYARGQGGPGGPTPPSSVPGMQMQPSLPYPNIPNMPFQVAGATLLSLPRGPFPGTAQALPIGQNISQVAPNGPSGFSGLIKFLMAQGLISLTKDYVGMEFDPDRLKAHHESVINSLYADLPRQCTTCGLRFKDQEEHSKHMDWHVSKNRTLKNRKTKPSPKCVDMWLTGTEALGTEAVPGFLPGESAVGKEEEDEELAAPADEDQNTCALCGEPFDDFYSDETEEWMYRGAVYMHAPAGLTMGMDRSKLGPIVHAKCRSDSHGLSSEDFKKSELEKTEEGSLRQWSRSWQS